MERHVAASRLDCADERQGEVIERLLSLTRSTDETTREMGWLLLSRVMANCTNQAFRANQAKLSKKVAELARYRPNLPAALYVRQLLIRNPQAGELHNNTIEKIILSLLDASLTDMDPKIRAVALELFGIRYGASGIARSLNTLMHVLKGSIIAADERDKLICCQALGQSMFRDKFIDLLFDALASSVHHSKIGDSIPRAQLLDVLALALKTPAWRAPAVRSIEEICDAARWAIAPLVPRIVSLLVGLLATPSASLFSCLASVCSRFAAASTLHKHIYIIYHSLSHPLHVQPYGNEAATLISSIIETSGYLVKPEVLISIQRNICENALRFVNSKPYSTMVYALLACGHELVPVPVNVARTLVARSSLPLSTLAHLCDSLTHPRIHDLAHNEVKKRIPTKTETEEAKEAEMAKLIESVQKENDEFVPTPDISEEVKMNEDTVQESDEDEEMEMIPPTTQDIPKPVQSAPVVTSSFVQKVQNKVKRKREQEVATKKERTDKKKAKAQAAVLEETEASVEDILSSFCPQ